MAGELEFLLIPIVHEVKLHFLSLRYFVYVELKEKNRLYIDGDGKETHKGKLFN